MTPLPKTTSFNLPSPLLLALVHSHLSRSPYYFLLPCRYGVSSRVANTARNRVCVQSVSLLNLSKIWYRFRFDSYLTPSTEHKDQGPPATQANQQTQIEARDTICTLNRCYCIIVVVVEISMCANVGIPVQKDRLTCWRPSGNNSIFF